MNHGYGYLLSLTDRVVPLPNDLLVPWSPKNGGWDSRTVFNMIPGTKSLHTFAHFLPGLFTQQIKVFFFEIVVKRAKKKKLPYFPYERLLFLDRDPYIVVYQMIHT